MTDALDSAFPDLRVIKKLFFSTFYTIFFLFFFFLHNQHITFLKCLYPVEDKLTSLTLKIRLGIRRAFLLFFLPYSAHPFVFNASAISNMAQSQTQINRWHLLLLSCFNVLPSAYLDRCMFVYCNSEPPTQ